MMDPFQRLFETIQQTITLAREEKDFLTARLKFRRLKKRQFLLQQGDICRYRTFVAKGMLRSYFEDPASDIYTVKFATEGWWIEDLDSFLNGRPATLTIDALEDAELLQLDKNSLDEIYWAVPKIEKYFRMELEKYTIAQQQRVLMNISMNAKERYGVFQQKCHHLMQRLPQRHIASFLGITPQFLSQLRAHH